MAGAPPPVWTMRLTGPIPGPIAAPTSLGEIAFASERKFAFNLNKASTITFTHDLREPTADRVLSTAASGGYILLFRNSTLMMVAELTSVEAGGGPDEHTAAVVATETMWPRFQTTLCGFDQSGLSGPTTPTDQGTWLNSALASLNAVSLNRWHTTIDTTGSITASNNITGGKWYFKPFLELVQELGATVAGFDFWQTPLDPLANGGLTGKFNIAPLKGTLKTGATLEYGTGRRNAMSWTWKVDNSQIANDVFVLPPDFPNNAGLPIVQAFDLTSYGVRGARNVVQSSDLQDTTLRQNYANLACAIRKVPRQQFTIQPMNDVSDGRVPQFGVDYTTGDQLRGRVVDNGITLLDANVRVYGVEVAVSDEGLQTDTLTLVNEA